MLQILPILSLPQHTHTHTHTHHLAPLGFDQAVVIDRGSRYVLISWDPPAARNGILINYTVIQGDTDAVLAPTVLEYNVTGLLPFSEYTFSVVVCTAVGCVENPSVTTITREDGTDSIPFHPVPFPFQTH